MIEIPFEKTFMPTVQDSAKSFFDNQRISLLQYWTIFICFLMNILDGMDVLVIAFTAKAITSEWTIAPESLGIVLSAAVAGMTLGALFIAPLADRFGRKVLILSCAILMGGSIFLTSYSQSVNQLVILRFISGLGIGGMLASVSTLASEYTPKKSKDFWVGLVMGGYPIGAVLTGFAASYIIPNFGWRMMFQFAGVATLSTIPLILFILPESIDFLIKKKPKDALLKVNHILGRMKMATLKALPKVDSAVLKVSVSELFKGERTAQTLILWSAFFCAFGPFYFLLSWLPKLTTDAGMPEELGYLSGIVFNLGSFVGILILGTIAMWIGLKRSILYFMISAAGLMILFGNFTGSAVILVLFGLIGFFLHAGFVGLYPLAAKIYPTEIRTTGIGWAIGAGRLGAVIGPIVAGYLVAAGLSITTNFLIFAIPCVLCGIAVMSIRSANVV